MTDSTGMLFLTAFGLGFAFCASPGAVTAQALRRGLERGFLPALSLQLGAMIGMALWAIVAILCSNIIVQHPFVRMLLGIAGGLLLLRLAWQALEAAYYGNPVELVLSDSRKDFALGVLLSVANPLPVAFWLSIGSSVIATSPKPFDTANWAVFLSGFLSSGLLWGFLLASITSWAKRFISPEFFRFVHLACGLVFSFFSINLLFQTLSTTY